MKKASKSEELYKDMIHLPHHVSPRRPRMSPAARAAQFLPFAALTGFDAAIKETIYMPEEETIPLDPDGNPL